MKRNPALDILRCAAIALVLGWHLPVPEPAHWLSIALWPWRGFGWAGVDLFFVLSGFLVGGLLMAEHQKKGKIDLGRFYERRAFKIWPAYYAMIGLFLLNRIRRHDSIKPLIGNLLNIQNYTQTYIRHTWSLAVEEHFYLLLGIVLLILARRNAINVKTVLWVYGASLVVSLGSRLAMLATNQDPINIQWFTNCRLDSLCLGVLLAALYHFKSPAWDWLANRRTLLWVVVIASLGIHVAQQYSPLMLSVGLTVVSIGSAALLILLFTAPPELWIGTAIRSKFGAILAWIGERSYGIYLWHTSSAPVVVWIFNKLYPKSAFAAYGAAVIAWIAAAIVLGYIAHRLIEGPFLKLRDRLRPPTVAALDVAQ